MGVLFYYYDLLDKQLENHEFLPRGANRPKTVSWGACHVFFYLGANPTHYSRAEVGVCPFGFTLADEGL